MQRAASVNPPSSTPALDEILRQKGIWDGVGPLKLHLGCGEQRLEGYVNVDFPQELHLVMRPAVDYEADITQMRCNDGSVDEIRLHHCFEHFPRVEALALLVRWHRWLKIGGRLRLETPDFMGCARTIVAESTPPKMRMALIRHLAGDQADAWAFHVDQWFEERFRATLPALGFEVVATSNYSWANPPYLSNVDVLAEKTEQRTTAEQFQACLALLYDSLVADGEHGIYDVWTKQLMGAI